MRGMRFILVNDRTPSHSSFCALCCEPITGGYLRESATRLIFCDQRCYAGHRRASVPTIRNRESA